ncbi:MAG: MFS transporter [Asticcacaulis sp.]|uniref:MFS transporter n=1 Tax=Asticcacaulis sp. TaxID=1872648 RepID=UPI003F7BA4CD
MSNASAASLRLIRALTYLMFMMFAMTTDSVGVIIPEIEKAFHLNNAEASAFQYATMGGIAAAGLFLGFLADRIGRKATIVLGLVLFALNSLLFIAGDRFGYFLILLFVSGASIGVFKTGALALIGDISTSTDNHTRTMNMVEGFFGVGAIIGPALVTQLVKAGLSWKWLYVIAGALCLLLILTALLVKYPRTVHHNKKPVSITSAVSTLRDPFTLAFSLGAMLYVAVEAAIYVWMPTLLKSYSGSLTLLATYALSAFFILRASGRFLGAAMLARMSWSSVLVVASGAILACFLAALLGGVSVAVISLPLSGLFMSVIYPTLNSKGISCFPKAEHGAVSGVILFFTCLSAAVAPLAMGAVSDHFGDAKASFALATAIGALLFGLLVLNMLFKPTLHRLKALDLSEYASGASAVDD